MKRNIYLILLIMFAIGFTASCGIHFHTIPDAKIVLGSDVIGKKLFYENKKLLRVTSISFGRFTSNSEDEIAVVADNGAQFLTRSVVEKEFVLFDRRGGKTVPIKAPRGGFYGFLNRGRGWQEVSLLDSKGHTKWKYPPERGPANDAADNMAVGDLNRDGKLEFVVGMNAGGGLRILDDKGILMHRYEAVNVFSVEVLDIDGDGMPEILHSGHGFVIRRSNGDIVRTFNERNGGVGHFSLLQPSVLYKEPIIVYIDGDDLNDRADNLNLIDTKGSFIKKFKLPGWGHHSAEGAVVYLNGLGKSPYYAFVRTIDATSKRSELLIFDLTSRLIFHEVMPSSQITVATHNIKGQDHEKLLVGADSFVWEYGLNPDINK